MSTPIAAWLEAHGLGRYAAEFERNDIGVDVLGDLEEADLDALGVSLGDRKRLARAAATHPVGADLAAPSSDVAAGGAADGWARHPGERKPVTMLFADVTGSTALTEALDAEDAHEVLYGAVRRMCEAVEENRGTVCRFMGDGVMAMFGAPVAFDDHAHWACRAALAMRGALERYGGEAGAGGRGLRIRIGLHAGEVVVLRVGEGEGASFDASGPTVPLAARMEATAEPGTVQMTAETYALVASRFAGERLGPVTVKGFPAPIATVRLLAERPHEAGGEPRPFVGRRAELAQVRAVLRSCLEERSGRLVYLRGEPGIGKTRLADRLADIARGLGFRVHRALALDFGAGRGRDPVRLLVRDLLGAAPESSAEQRARCAGAAVASGLVPPEREAHLCDLLDIPPPASLRAAYEGLDAEARAAERMALLGTLVGALADREPRLVLVENLHWAPAPVRGYLGAVARCLPAGPAVLVVTSRTEGDPLGAGWQADLEGLPATLLGLGPLSRAEARELADRVGVEAGDLVEECVERSGRNPLFLEHLLGSVRAGADRGALPTSVRTSVEARVDTLDPADRRAVRAAAVLGQRFDVGALRAVLAEPDYDCARLVARGLVRPEGDGYLFAHALVQEAVVAGLLRADRRALHARAAEWYEGRDPLLCAVHLDRAGDGRAPLAYLEGARAESAALRFVTARGLVERGLELAAEPAVHAALHALHGHLLMGIGEMRAGAEAYREAADRAEDPSVRCAAWIGAAHALRNTGAYGEGLAALDEAEREADRHRLTGELAAIHHHRGNIRFLQVDAGACEDEQRRALELARACGSPEMEALALSGMVRASYLRGRMRTGLAYAEQCVALARRHGLDGIAYGHVHMVGIGHHHELRLEEARLAVLEGVENAARVGVPRQGVVAGVIGSEVMADVGRPDEARALARGALEITRRVGEPRYRPAARSILAKLDARDGDREVAERELRVIWDGLDTVDRPYSGPLVLGALVVATRDDALWRRVVAEGRRFARTPVFGELLLHFFRDAIHCATERGEWAIALELAGDLARYTREEPLPLTRLYIDWARAAAASSAGGRPESRAALERVRERAAGTGLRIVLPALDRQLAALGPGTVEDRPG